MTGRPATGRLRFAEFEIDADACVLLRDGTPVRLQQQPFDVLRRLVDRPGQLVSRDDLRQELWPSDTFVDFDHSLNIAINKLRAALNDSAEHPRFIQTIPRRGYRFIGVLSPTDLPERAVARHLPGAMVIGAGLGVVVVAALLAAWVLRPTPAPAARGFQSIAVLQLDNLSPDPNDAYLAEGISDELTT